MTANNVYLFVYGTLRSDDHNSKSNLLGGTLVATGCTVRGTLYNFGHYPGVELNEFAGDVVGELWAVPKGNLARLDNYEGEQYVRVIANVRMAGGHSTPAMVYEAADVEGLDIIPWGNWVTRPVPAG